MAIHSAAVGNQTSPQERQVVLQAGLPDIILYGTATWALAAGHLIQRFARSVLTRLRRFVGRFTAVVMPGTTITLEYGELEGDTSPTR